MYFWHLYLGNHFLGYFDKAGLPNFYPETGWALLISAWPVWTVPFLLCSLASFLSAWHIQKKLREKIKQREAKANVASPPPTDLLDTLSGQRLLDIQKNFELDQLHHQITDLKHEIQRHQQHEYEKQNKLNQLSRDFNTVKRENSQYLEENTYLKERLSTVETNLQETTTLLEKLIEAQGKEEDQGKEETQGKRGNTISPPPS